MSDGDSDHGKPQSGDAKPEVISPASEDKAPRARKEPPVLEGEAEVLSEKTTARSNSETPRMTTPDEAPARSSASIVIVALVAGIAGALAVGAGGYVLGFGRVSLEAQNQTIAALDARVTALDSRSTSSLSDLRERSADLVKRIETAEATLNAQAQSPENIAAIKAQLDTLSASSASLSKSVEDLTKANVEAQGRLANLETTLTALNTALSALSPRLDDTVKRVTALEDKAKDPDAAGRAALGLALASLARASEGAGPFKAELDAIATFLPDEPELAQLAPIAGKGVPTLAALKEQFPQMAQAVFDAERQAGSKSLWSKFWGNAKSLITIRRTGEIAGNDTEAVIARMEARLNVNDLAAARAQAKLLKGAAAKAAQKWVAQADARLNIDTLVRSLSARVASRLAKGD